ncbi:MAG: PIG-L family deacetylase [Gemmataceae bacterium]
MPDALPDRLDVLAVAPHPDDLEILCGGTIAKLVKQGYKVGMADLTSGEPTPRGSLDTRKKEAETARVALGGPLRINVELPNRVLMDSPENRFKLATVFRTYRPGILIVGAGRTPAASPDHHQGHLLGEAARFYSQLTKWDDRFDGTKPYRVPHLVYCPFPFDAEQRNWHSTFVVDISDTFDAKLESIRAYESQFDAERFERVKHMIGSANGYHGARCGFRYGELFALPHPVGAPDLVTLVHGSKPTAPPDVPVGQGHLPMG